MRDMGAFKPGEMVGGTAAHWGGNARRFLPHDLEVHSGIKERYGASFIPENCHLQDWGVTWTRSSRTTTSSSISLASAVRPARPSYEGRLFADAVSSLGYVLFQGPTEAMTQDYRNLYHVQMLACARGGFCSSHVCAQGAKTNPFTSVHPALARQPTFELRPLCNVLRVNTDSTGKQATGVTYIDARGNEVEQRASIVVLGAYCFSNTRLLLLSGIAHCTIRTPATAWSAATTPISRAVRCTCSSMIASSIRSLATSSSTRRSTNATAT
jgi:gluconate 2-dehydrogenase alpha chain